MREIKFRGKSLHDVPNTCKKDEMIYGGLAILGLDIFYIVQAKREMWAHQPMTVKFISIEVDPETVGQQTVLKDRNGKEIYEGDVVRILIYREYTSSPSTKDKYRNEVVTNGCHCGLNTNGMVSICPEGQEEYIPQMEIIGNIHENPELLEQAK